MTPLLHRIERFIATGRGNFDELAAAAARFGYERVEPYRRLCDRRGVTPATLDDWRAAPAVPTSAFKSLRLAAAEPLETFRSSGTTRGAERRSVHYHPYPDLYRTVIDATFPAACLPARSLDRGGPQQGRRQQRRERRRSGPRATAHSLAHPRSRRSAGLEPVVHGGPRLQPPRRDRQCLGSLGQRHRPRPRLPLAARAGRRRSRPRPRHRPGPRPAARPSRKANREAPLTFPPAAASSKPAASRVAPWRPRPTRSVDAPAPCSASNRTRWCASTA